MTEQIRRLPERYVLQRSYDGLESGTVVYESMGYDYGCSSDDYRSTGIEHISVSLKSNGDYPFRTVPKDYLQEMPYADNPSPQPIDT